MTLASKKEEDFYIISKDRVIYGPTRWSGKLVDIARWYKDVVQFDGVKIVQVVANEKAI